jgi:hypothetical protein
MRAQGSTAWRSTRRTATSSSTASTTARTRTAVVWRTAPAPRSRSWPPMSALTGWASAFRPTPTTWTPQRADSDDSQIRTRWASTWRALGELYLHAVEPRMPAAHADAFGPDVRHRRRVRAGGRQRGHRRWVGASQSTLKTLPKLKLRGFIKKSFSNTLK